MNYTNDNEFPGGSYNSRLTVAEFEKIFDEYYHLVKRIITNNGCPRNDIEDAVQETFFKVWMKYELHDRTASFEAWIKRIARNEAINHHRRLNRKSYTRAISDEILAAFIDENNNFLDDSTSREIELIVREEIEKLDDLEKEAITLFYEHECTYEEIAMELFNKTNGVYQLLRSARAKLREALQRRLFNPDD
jgi:RNA polymerase sigma-70 factor (ECF subfamily)